MEAPEQPAANGRKRRRAAKKDAPARPQVHFVYQFTMNFSGGVSS